MFSCLFVRQSLHSCINLKYWFRIGSSLILGRLLAQQLETWYKCSILDKWLKIYQI